MRFQATDISAVRRVFKLELERSLCRRDGITEGRVARKVPSVSGSDLTQRRVSFSIYGSHQSDVVIISSVIVFINYTSIFIDCSLIAPGKFQSS